MNGNGTGSWSGWNSSRRNQIPFPFRKLPAELRIKIYYNTCLGRGIQYRKPALLEALKIDKILYEEAKEIFEKVACTVTSKNVGTFKAMPDSERLNFKHLTVICDPKLHPSTHGLDPVPNLKNILTSNLESVTFFWPNQLARTFDNDHLEQNASLKQVTAISQVRKICPRLRVRIEFDADSILSSFLNAYGARDMKPWPHGAMAWARKLY